MILVRYCRAPCPLRRFCRHRFLRAIQGDKDNSPMSPPCPYRRRANDDSDALGGQGVPYTGPLFGAHGWAARLDTSGSSGPLRALIARPP